MLRLSFIGAALLACTVANVVQATSRYEQTSDGVIVMPETGNTKRLRLQVMSERIIHVTALPDANARPATSLMVNATPDKGVKFEVKQQGDTVLLKTQTVTASVSLHDGVVRFIDAQGKNILQEQRRDFKKYTVDDHDYYAIQQQFNPATTEAFYGLGQHQNAQMNYNGEDVQLAQHNMDVAIPFVISFPALVEHTGERQPQHSSNRACAASKISLRFQRAAGTTPDLRAHQCS